VCTRSGPSSLDVGHVHRRHDAFIRVTYRFRASGLWFRDEILESRRQRMNVGVRVYGIEFRSTRDCRRHTCLESRRLHMDVGVRVYEIEFRSTNDCRRHACI